MNPEAMPMMNEALRRVDRVVGGDKHIRADGTEEVWPPPVAPAPPVAKAIRLRVGNVAITVPTTHLASAAWPLVKDRGWLCALGQFGLDERIAELTLGSTRSTPPASG